ncbi:hypothetical protein LOTGIDRAFT_236684 [Lottia gigantea]|uniref:Uncharacterized protein n=1 Tax=Lottia gigantea TaxID=225164 RepID=V4B4L7_LOTGI|nr:hypothetical protein LOTGIDRAFT_236684 [Lottia gigantea]ESO83364.1 hypothetical protein LOTGIDRAFT_236684 [Lottia gigantea]
MTPDIPVIQSSWYSIIWDSGDRLSPTPKPLSNSAIVFLGNGVFGLFLFFRKPSVEEQKILIPSASMNGIRHRNKGSFGSNISGSVISLFTGRSNTQKSFYDSRQSLYSNTGQDKLLLPQTNGGPGYFKLPSNSIPNTEIPVRRASFDISDSQDLELQRERANTDHSDRDIPVVTTERERKFSTPFNFTFFRKERDDKPDSSASKPSRFQVEPVTNDPDQDFVAPKTRRSGQIMCQLEKYNMKHNISRPPVLSAIEEGGTIHSIRQLPLSGDNSDLSDPFDDPHLLQRQRSTDTNRSISSWEDEDILDEPYSPYANNRIIPEIIIEECK